MPGPGVGGHCLAVAPWFIIEKEPNLSQIIKSSRILNDNMPNYVYEVTDKILKGDKNKKITILGVTYKANTDDMRESPIIKLIDKLVENNYQVRVFDPYVKSYHLNNLNILKACEDSDLLVLGVNHDDFKELPFEKIRLVMKGNIILDTRNFLDKEKIVKAGFEYKLLGCN